MKRLLHGQLKVGVPLQFSVYDASRNLLLSQGITLSSEAQLSALVERGLYADDRALAGGAGAADSQGKIEQGPPVIEELGRIRRELNAVLSERHIDSSGFCAKMLGLATRLQIACRRDPDCCLAALLLDRQSRYATRHMVHVAIVSELIAEGAGLDASTRFSIIAAALTMNLAMLELQDTLHGRQRDGPTNDQKLAIRQHPTATERMLARFGVDDPVWLQLVRDHHETLDGTGYPKRICGDQVATGVRIIALADGYTARMEPRPERAPKPPNESLRDVFLSGGKAVDPLLAALMVKRIGIHPPGAIVELENREIAVVTKRLENANAPEVHSFLSPERSLYSRPIRRVTDKTPFKIRAPARLDGMRVNFDPMQFWASN